jgi:cathepsin A (carboxypeptidase C)
MSAASDIDLTSVGEAGEGFVRITSARHPKHSVRIKETTGWCDPDVRSYTGYVMPIPGSSIDMMKATEVELIE